MEQKTLSPDDRLPSTFRPAENATRTGGSVADFLGYLDGMLPVGDGREEMKAVLDSCRVLPPEQQLADLPRVYLLCERHLTAGHGRMVLRTKVRRALEERFPELLARPEFGLVFIRERPQEYQLCRMVLASALRNASSVVDKIGNESLARILSWIEDAPNVALPVPFDLRPSLPRHNSEWNALLARMSREVYLAWKDDPGESLTQSFFERAYDDAATRYALLDTFPIVGNLLPPGLLDSEKFNLLSRSQLQQMYVRSLHDANFHNIKLAEQNRTLDAVHRELELAHDSLELRVAQRTSELETANRELRAAKESAEGADRAKSQFLAHMSHELRTPLNAIIGFSEMIEGAFLGPLDERYQVYATHIYKSGHHLLAIINDILDLAKLESGKFELHEREVDITDVMNTCRNLIIGHANDNGLTLTIDADSALPHIYADELRLKQIVINLLSNAVKFTPKGGVVTVTVVRDRTGGITLDVQDTGRGMHADDIERALQPFVQIDSASNGNEEGTGLGLPLVKRLAELHDGVFEIASTPDVGTIATIRLPASRVIGGGARASL